MIIFVDDNEEVNIILFFELMIIIGVVCDIKIGLWLFDIFIEVFDIYEEFIINILIDKNGEYKICELLFGIFNVKVSLEIFIEFKIIILLLGEIGIFDFEFVGK